MICNQCGHNNYVNTEFCEKCGSPLTDNTILNSSAQEQYQPFGTGAKVWFVLCAIGQILSGLMLIVAFIVSEGSTGGWNLLLGCMGIAFGGEYAYLLANRKKASFTYLFGSAICFMFLYIVMAIFEDSSYLLSIFSVIINIGITMAILRNYESEKVEIISDIPNTSVGNTTGGSIQCPVCGGKHLQAVSETNTTGGGYNAGNGCCGYILLGPLGILCGACGSQTKTTNRTFFICMDCGHKFAK